ncbi:MAG: hypothetical protein M1823_000438 [Watsoniomyces obsoletus]|nr:MAG: hypothetical protein M1823_000438 [Watsoniomyces obsoletus]
MAALEVARLIVYIVLYPMVTLFNWLLFALTPILHLLRFLRSGLQIPLHIMASLEPVWIYLGVAVAVGMVAGSILYLMSSTLITLLHLRSNPEEQPKRVHHRSETNSRPSQARARRPLSARGSTDMTRPRLGMPLINPYIDSDHIRGRHRGGLMAQTILEEEDSDELF